MMNIYYVFGSPSSQDSDVLVLLETIPSIDEAKKLCVKLKAELQPLFSKQVNVNLGVMGERALCSVFKGSVDEVNNSIIDTYVYHEQAYPLHLTERLGRDLDLKVIRATRVILSYLSRSQFRVVVKEALKGDFSARVEALRQVDLSEEIRDSKYPLSDVYKSLAFQMGQTLALLEGLELFTKESVANYYPSLKSFLLRESGDLRELEAFKVRYYETIKAHLPLMKKLAE